MESPAKKRSIFGFASMWRSSTAPPADSDATSKSSATNAAAGSPSLARVESGNASAPESPVKRASDNQLASRKIIIRPQGPSSKLSQSFTAADFDRLPSSSTVPKSTSFSGATGTTPRRKPGDNPYKASTYSSSTIAHPPTNSTNSFKTTNFSASGAATTPRNIFRSSAIYQRPGLPTFSPRLPANTMKQSFPPNTPGKAPRGSTADVSGRGLAHTASSELFKMRIPSPPRHLTGEVLAKEVPEDPSRSGSVYADEFLAHYCPPDLDEHQRRQFFCILDLRRLKYAADEVFTNKDWKINVLNFAKEYEKSRSLIMLRYGLYEFKTVRASESVKKEWKQKHGIASSDDESEQAVVVKPNVGSKRKAEEDLKSTDTALTASSSNGNKRARAPEAPAPTPMKTKRKADMVGEPDENQPAKLLKPSATPQKTPSATKSVFESIANKAPLSTTPAKSPVKNSLFASGTGHKLSNGTLGRSVLEAGTKPSIAASNIFANLSDTSKGSPNNDADAESETSSAEGEDDGEGEGEGESEAQETSPSEEPSAAASVEAPTPQFGAAKTPITVNGTSSASSDGGESSQGRSLFDRITRGSDGQPVRKLPPQEGRSPFAVSPDKERSASPAKDLPGPAPISNNTWNTNTPIKFSTGGSSLFGAAGQKPAASSTIDFGLAATKKPEPAAQDVSKPAAQNIFGLASKKTEEPAAKSDAIAKVAAIQPAISFPAKSGDSSAAPPSIFANFGAASKTGPSLFGIATPAFGQPKNKEETKEPPAASTSTSASTPTPIPAAASLFGLAHATSSAEPAKPNMFQSSTLFGSQAKTEPTTQAAVSFGKPAEAQGAPAPATSLFGTTAAKAPLFGAASAVTGEPAAKNISFGSGDSKPASALFGLGTTPALAPSAPKPAAPSESKPLFGSSTPSAVTSGSKPLFGASTTSTAAPAAGSIFGNIGALTSGATQEAKPLFGASPFGQSAATTAPVMFGAAPASGAAPSSGSIFNFGNAQAPAASQPAAATTSFTFSAGGSDAPAINNPFAAGGSTSAPSSFNFGNTGSNDSSQQPSSGSFTFGGSGPAPSISFGGASDAGSQAPQQGNVFGGSSMFNFGGATSQPNGASMFSQKPPSTTSMFGNNLAPGGGGTSTGTNSPFTFGGASSLATTPATGTPEPAAEPEDSRGTNADGDEAPQEQISLTEGGPGEEDESVVHEIRAKAVKLVTGGDSDDDDSGDKKKNPWKTQGIGPLRILKHKTTGVVRMLMRAEPRGHVALNKLVLPNFTYKVDPAGGKYVKLTTATDDGKGLETWMLQVKTPDAAKKLAEALEANKKANEKEKS